MWPAEMFPPVLSFISCVLALFFFISPILYFQLFSLRLSNCRHMLASIESNNSSNLTGIDSTRSSFREPPCSIIIACSNHQPHAERSATNGQPFSHRYPRTATLRWAALQAASPRPRSFTRTWTAATAARPTPYLRTLRTRTRF